MKLLLIFILSLLLMGCGHLTRYTLLKADGIIYNNIKSKEDCELINTTFKLNGLCIVQ